MLTDAEFAEIESRMFDAAQADDEGSDLVYPLLFLLAADVPPLMAEVRRLRGVLDEAVATLESGRPLADEYALRLLREALHLDAEEGAEHG